MRVLFRVSRQDSHRVHYRSGSLVTVQRTSKASGVLFSSEPLDQLSAAWQTLRKRHREAENDLVERLSDIFDSSASDMALSQLVEIVAELDVLQSFAKLSNEKGFVRPRITSRDGDEWTLRIMNPFDPFEDNSRVLRNGDKHPPLEIKLSRDGDKTFLLLTSNNNSVRPNGFTLQLIGLIAMLSQIGCFVPCHEADLPIFDAIFLRSGAYDEQILGHSTFMTEMLEVNRIFRLMTKNSLVLIDDICRGTSNGKANIVGWCLCNLTNNVENCFLWEIVIVFLAEGLALALSLCQHLMAFSVLTCLASEWRELVDQLLVQPATIVPQCQYEKQPGSHMILQHDDDDDRYAST